MVKADCPETDTGDARANAGAVRRKIRRRLLVVDDDADVLRAARFVLRARTPGAEFVDDPDLVAERLRTGEFDVLLLDMNFGAGKRHGDQGLAILRQVLREHPDLVVVLMTAFGSVSVAVEGLKSGAFDFILKPWNNDNLLSVVEAAFDASRFSRERPAHASLARISLSEMERRAIEDALRRAGGNVSAAAASLGVTRQALYRKMRHHGV